MSTNRLPDFKHTLALAKGNLDATELSECHGVVCGLLCRQPDSSLDAFVGLLGMLEIVSRPGPALRNSLDELLSSSKLQLDDEDLGLSLWLPADDETLEDRTMALTQWCSGFLAGLGGGGGDALEAISRDANEGLEDIRQISMADVSDTSQSEADEKAFAEIVEYIRVVTLMIREDLKGPGQQDMIH